MGYNGPIGSTESNATHSMNAYQRQAGVLIVRLAMDLFIIIVLCVFPFVPYFLWLSRSRVKEIPAEDLSGLAPPSRTKKRKYFVFLIVALLISGGIIATMPTVDGLALFSIISLTYIITLLGIPVVFFSSMKKKENLGWFLLFWPLFTYELLLKLVFDSQGHGRPFRLNGQPLVTRVLHDSAWVDNSHKVSVELDVPTRTALQAYWSHHAVAEHASVAAFSKLSLQLIGLGAPPELLNHVLTAAMQEVEHARLCFSMASSFSEESVSPAAMPEILLKQDSTATLQQLVEECFLDGCIMESFSAHLGEASYQMANDMNSRHVFSVIAKDEKYHSDLSWEILSFLTKENKSAIDKLLVQLRRIKVLPSPSALPEQVAPLFESADGERLRYFGILPQEKANEIWVATVSKAERRLELSLENGMIPSMTQVKDDPASVNINVM